MPLTITGVPRDIDSTSGIPKPSFREALTRAVAESSKDAYSSSLTPPWNTSEPAGARASSRSRTSSDALLRRWRV